MERLFWITYWVQYNYEFLKHRSSYITKTQTQKALNREERTVNQAIQHTLEAGQDTDSSWKEHSPKTDCIYLISCLVLLSSFQIVTTLIENQYRVHDQRDPLVVSICCTQKSWLQESVHQRWSTSSCSVTFGDRD